MMSQVGLNRKRTSVTLLWGLIYLFVTFTLLIGSANGIRADESVQSNPTASRELQTPIYLRDQIRQSESIGEALYFHDKAAAMGTDVLAKNLGDLRKLKLSGYLVLREGDEQFQPTGSWRVSFFTETVDPKVAYEVFVKPGRLTTAEFKQVAPHTQPLEGVLCLFKARQTALEALPERVQPINPVVLPAELIGENGILVYLIAGTSKPGIVVFGKHYRVLVSEDGKIVKRFEPLSKSILEMPLQQQGKAATDVKFLYVTHLLTEYPFETHVFASLLHKIPILVMTNQYIWKVEHGKIRLLKKREQ